MSNANHVRSCSEYDSSKSLKQALADLEKVLKDGDQHRLQHLLAQRDCMQHFLTKEFTNGLNALHLCCSKVNMDDVIKETRYAILRSLIDIIPLSRRLEYFLQSSSCGWTALHIAAKNKDYKAAAILLDSLPPKSRPYLIDKKDNDSRTAAEYDPSKLLQKKIENYQHSTDPSVNMSNTQQDITDSSECNDGRPADSSVPVLSQIHKNHICDTSSIRNHSTTYDHSSALPKSLTSANGTSTFQIPWKKIILHILKEETSEAFMGIVADVQSSSPPHPFSPKRAKKKSKVMNHFIRKKQKKHSAHPYRNTFKSFHNLVRRGQHCQVSCILNAITCAEERWHLLSSCTNSGQKPYHLASKDLKMFKVLLTHTPDHHFNIINSVDGKGQTVS